MQSQGNPGATGQGEEEGQRRGDDGDGEREGGEGGIGKKRRREGAKKMMANGQTKTKDNQ